jgi:hypothetical protein
MNGREVIRHGGRWTGLALSLPLLLVMQPVAAQSPSGLPSPSVVASTGAPVASPDRAAIDPDSPVGRLLGMRDTLSADRALLAELRKDVPSTKDAGAAFVDHVAQLALTSDPAGLGVIVSRVRDAAPAWLDWRDGQYTTTQEAAEAYAQSGAAAFDVSWESLHDAVLLTVVNRLDTIIDLADRIEDER